MGTIHVKYDEVYAEVAKLKSYLASNVFGLADTGYRKIQADLSRMDGKANAVLMEIMEAHHEKTAVTADTIYKLLDFITVSTKQIEINEQRIARAMSAGRK